MLGALAWELSQCSLPAGRFPVALLNLVTEPLKAQGIEGKLPRSPADGGVAGLLISLILQSFAE